MGRLIKMSLGARRSAFRARTDGSAGLSVEALEEEKVLPDVEGAKRLVGSFLDAHRATMETAHAFLFSIMV